jgi:hypothetical protein
MKKMIAVSALVAMIAGCSLPLNLYRAAVTPDIKECMGLKGQTLKAAEDRFGKLVAMTIKEDKYTLIFKKGNLTAAVTTAGIDPNSEILSVSCSTN